MQARNLMMVHLYDVELVEPLNWCQFHYEAFSREIKSRRVCMLQIVERERPLFIMI